MGSIVNRGNKSAPKWYVTYKDVDGRWRMVNSKQITKARAARFLALAEERVAQGKVGIPEPEGQPLTLNAFLDEWLDKHSKVACTSHDDNVGRAQHLRRFLGTTPLRQITSDHVATLRARMASETVTDSSGKESPRWAAATVNRVLALLRKALNDAATWKKIAAAPKVKLLPVPETAFDHLHRDEAERLLSHTRTGAPNDFPLYAGAIFTGARMGELYGLRWPDVDLERGQVTICRSYEQPYTKSKKVRRVRLNRQLATILKDWRRTCPKPADGDPALVFPREDGTMRTREKPPLGFADHLTASRCHLVTFHDLRHTAASLMVMSGAALRFVQQQLGHSTILVTEKYAHLSPDFVGVEADRVSLDVQDGLGQLVVLESRR